MNSVLVSSPVSAATTTGSVDWGSNQGQTATNNTYGINIYQGNDPTVASNSTYKANVSYMKNGIIRYHYAGQCGDSTTDAKAWVKNPTTASYSWDATKINTILSNTFSNSPVIMIDIANWPSYMDDGTGKLKTSMYDAYAQFCADLVSIVNIQQNRGVQYFEVTNEKDDIYSANISELANIVVKCYNKMKLIDSTIKVGGPAFARSDLISQRVDPFLQVAAGTIDFVSYHSYTSGSTSDSNSTIWDTAQGLGQTTTNFKSTIAKYTTRNVETFHDEFNISWNPPDNRMNNEIGMVYDALSLISIAKSGPTGVMAWNESDGWYGKLGGPSTYDIRASANLYNFLNNDMCGPIKTSTTADSKKVDIMSVKTGSWDKILLVNRSEADQTVQLSFFNWQITPTADTMFTVKRIYGWGTAYDTIKYSDLTGAAGLSLGSNSIAILVLDESTISSPSKPISGKIRAVNYDAMYGVTTQPTTDIGGGFNVTNIDLGDWMDYTVNVTSTATYLVQFRVASYWGTALNAVQIKNSSGTVLTSLTVPQTWNDQTFTTVSADINLSAGIQTIRVYAASGGWNFNWMNFVSQTPGKTIPGKVTAVSYDAMYGVTTQPTTDIGGGFNVTNIDLGDWMDYTVNVTSTATYLVQFRVASYWGTALNAVQIKNSSGTVLTSLTVPQTWNDQTFTTVSADINLSAGIQTIRVYAASGGWNFNWMNFLMQ